MERISRYDLLNTLQWLTMAGAILEIVSYDQNQTDLQYTVQYLYYKTVQIRLSKGTVLSIHLHYTLYIYRIGCYFHFYAPNFEKVGSILVSACAFVCPSVQKKIQARVLKFHIWIPRRKIAYPYFFLVRIISPCRVMPL